MAKSSPELIRELTTDVRLLEAGNQLLREQLVDLKSADQKRQAEGAELRKENAELRRELAEARQETALVKQLLQEHIKKTDLADSRRWGLIILVLGGIFSLVTGLIVTLVRK